MEISGKPDIPAEMRSPRVRASLTFASRFVRIVVTAIFLASTRPPAALLAISRASVRTMPKFNAGGAVGDKEPAGSVALARLIASGETAAGRTAPSLALPDLDGTEVSLETMRGKVVLLNFWATWCGACRTEMPSLERLYRDFGHYPDFALLTVSIDQRDRSSVEQFMVRHGYDFPVLLDTENVASAAYGVSALPSTFVIGRNGQIIWNGTGALDWSDANLREALKELLEKKPEHSTPTLETHAYLSIDG